jgi:inosine-uridine nucleoside N-ribohydrolase
MQSSSRNTVAIILAAYNPSIELLGISTVHGNQSLEKTTENGLRVLSIIGREDIDVVAGSAQPLMRPCVACPGENRKRKRKGTKKIK